VRHDYEISDLIGAGGMGQVYRARDLRLNRDVAVKVLPHDIRHDPDRLARFEREAQALAALNHPNIATVHGVDDAGGEPILIMELVDGPTLAERLREGPLPIEEARAMALQMVEVSPDGKRFLMRPLVQAEATATAIDVVLNFVEELRQRIR
jgi:serine/threonine protein kinase